ncbi:MAG: HepT-like ribonuclease domain-containing protein [Acidobacteriaceae bacterium]
MSDSAQREPRFYIDDMIGGAEKVMTYTGGLDQAGFVAGGLSFDATLRNLELIGEAATHIPDAVRAANPQIPWRYSCLAPQSACAQGKSVVTEPTITCPNCKTEIKLTESLAAPLIESTRKQFVQ